MNSENIKKVTNQAVEQLVEALNAGHSEALARYLAAMAKFRAYSSLVVVPHDCRRVFASEHLNNDTPVHVIQALLGHATLDTVMVYAKLYPRKMIEEYRKPSVGSTGPSMGKRVSRIQPGKSGTRSPRAAVCATWELICAHFQPGSIARAGSSASDVTTPSQKRVQFQFFEECWRVTSASSAQPEKGMSPPGR
jgi:Phage integrase family